MNIAMLECKIEQKMTKCTTHSKRNKKNFYLIQLNVDQLLNFFENITLKKIAFHPTNYEICLRILYQDTLDFTQLLQPRKHFLDHFIGAIQKMPFL